MIHHVRKWIMGKPYSLDLRGRIGYIDENTVTAAMFPLAADAA
jgi:hypothetical protein